MVMATWAVLGVCALVLLARGNRPFAVVLKGLGVNINISRGEPPRKD